ncbi:hypothetical protein ZYGR_0AD05710 [Zygosaccharomyces rouxii]|uniref:D-isomer specific 2-hydroxyacid dehydrogenase NAD-binding domain-containing protein n=1 Tax=Zygosaccharomyces rouxii TaxID=4956 RepID=A0A1Q3A6V1_ZYGRO|nr:hypothetical protein ZYGR_0AD05710 [Zygosaccharomyces rouxii]
MLDKPTVLFVAAPNQESHILRSSQFNDRFHTLTHVIESKDSFLQFLANHQAHDIRAIYGGYPAFIPIGGLQQDLIEHELFPKNLKCIAICSRGHNGFDLDCLSEHGIQLYKYQDDNIIYGNELKDFQRGQVGNDVADSALWHILEGFRKFSYQQSLTRKNDTTLAARSEALGKPGFAFGHELQGLKVESPRGKKCLILGLGSIGKRIGFKLQYGLEMEIHYSKRMQDPEVSTKHGWIFHKLDDTLYEHLWQFNAIVIALPLTDETKHLIDNHFLSHCNGPELVIVNIGRGSILHRDQVHEALQKGKLRHLGEDVFYNEPIVDQELRDDIKYTTVTPHIGSSTVQVFYQSCELALANILEATSGGKTDPLSRVV